MAREDLESSVGEKTLGPAKNFGKIGRGGSAHTVNGTNWHELRGRQERRQGKTPIIVKGGGVKIEVKQKKRVKKNVIRGKNRSSGKGGEVSQTETKNTARKVKEGGEGKSGKKKFCAAERGRNLRGANIGQKGKLIDSTHKSK